MMRGSFMARAVARRMRQSVDITRLSTIVRGNLEKDVIDNSEFYPGAKANEGGDIKLDNADAELDFSGIADIGHGFADELFRVFGSAHPGLELKPVHMAPRVAAMVAAACVAA